MEKHILIHPEYGVYIGSCFGLGFWSRLDAADQDSAILFNSPDDALSYAATWDNLLQGLTTAPVVVEGEKQTFIHKDKLEKFW